MSEPVELKGFITRLNTSNDADGTERVTEVTLSAVPMSSGKAKQLHELFGEVGSLPSMLLITVEAMRWESCKKCSGTGHVGVGPRASRLDVFHPTGLTVCSLCLGSGRRPTIGKPAIPMEEVLAWMEAAKEEEKLRLEHVEKQALVFQSRDVTLDYVAKEAYDRFIAGHNRQLRALHALTQKVIT